jgi:hypothetical protein
LVFKSLSKSVFVKLDTSLQNSGIRWFCCCCSDAEEADGDESRASFAFAAETVAAVAAADAGDPEMVSSSSPIARPIYARFFF